MSDKIISKNAETSNPYDFLKDALKKEYDEDSEQIQNQKGESKFDRIKKVSDAEAYDTLKQISDVDILEHAPDLIKKKYNLDFCTGSRFNNGYTKPDFLVDGYFEKGKAYILAADGGTGKGMLTLDLGYKIACPIQQEGKETIIPTDFIGQKICEFGNVIFVLGEDTENEIKRRLKEQNREANNNMRFICLTDYLGSGALFEATSRGQYRTTEVWNTIIEQIIRIKPKLIIFDPISAFCTIDIDKDNIGAAYVGRHLATLANMANATVLVCHHTVKGFNEDLRSNIRGVSGFVNSVRGAALLWIEKDEKQADNIRKKLGITGKNDVLYFQMVKSNSATNSNRITLIRNECGVPAQAVVPWGSKEEKEKREREKRNLLKNDIKKAAERAQPYKRTGENNGLYAFRSELDPKLQNLSKTELEILSNELLNNGEIVLCTMGGNSRYCRNWLDVPDGPIATGKITEYAGGSPETAEKQMRQGPAANTEAQATGSKQPAGKGARKKNEQEPVLARSRRSRQRTGKPGNGQSGVDSGFSGIVPDVPDSEL